MEQAAWKADTQSKAAKRPKQGQAVMVEVLDKQEKEWLFDRDGFEQIYGKPVNTRSGSNDEV